MDESRSQVITVQLDGGLEIKVQATALGGSEDVSGSEKIMPFSEITDTIEKLGQAVLSTFQKIKPDKASVEFGVEVAIESGSLTALIVKGSSTGNLKVTLEWGK